MPALPWTTFSQPDPDREYRVMAWERAGELTVCAFAPDPRWVGFTCKSSHIAIIR